MAMIAGCYLLFRRANAIAPNISPPIRLRRWTGIFLISLALNQVWYMQLFFLTSSEDIEMVDLIGGLIQSVTLLPLTIVVLLAMLQDRRRPLWPFALMIAPAVAGMAASDYFFLCCCQLRSSSQSVSFVGLLDFSLLLE